MFRCDEFHDAILVLGSVGLFEPVGNSGYRFQNKEVWEKIRARCERENSKEICMLIRLLAQELNTKLGRI